MFATCVTGDQSETVAKGSPWTTKSDYREHREIVVTYSGYSRKQPPPIDPPPQARVRTYWRGCVQLWQAHQPDANGRCAACGRQGACPTLTAVDALLADALGKASD